MIKPIRNQILVKPFLLEEKSVGGIIVPESFRGYSDKGEIKAVGNGTKETPMQFAEGEIVFRVKDWGTPIEDEGVTYFLMDQNSILAKA